MASHPGVFKHKLAQNLRPFLAAVCLCIALPLILLWGHFAAPRANEAGHGAACVPIPVYAVCHRDNDCAYWYEKQDGEWVAGVWCPATEGGWVSAGPDAVFWQRDD